MAHSLNSPNMLLNFITRDMLIGLFHQVDLV